MIKKVQCQNSSLLLVLPELLLGLDGSEHYGRELGGNCLQQNNHQVSNNTSTTLFVKSGFGFWFQSAFCSYWPLFSSKKMVGRGLAISEKSCQCDCEYLQKGARGGGETRQAWKVEEPESGRRVKEDRQVVSEDINAVNRQVAREDRDVTN